MENLGVLDCLTGDDGSLQLSDTVKEFENLDVALLEDLDSYMQDINDRLTISRMVSNSVIKGIVNAVEQKAAEKIYSKELEVAGLRERLNFYLKGINGNGSLGTPVRCLESKYSTKRMYYSRSERKEESLDKLINVVQEQFTMLKKEMDKIKGCSFVSTNKSGSDLVGLGGILDEKKVSEKWMDVDKMLQSLSNTLENGYKQMDDTVYAYKALLCEWEQEREFQGEIEDMVIRNCIQSFQDDFEEKLWDQSSRYCAGESINWTERIKEISNLCQDLDAMSKSLFVPESGQLMSLEVGDERNNNKKSDHSHFKNSGPYRSSSTPLWEGNGKHEESIIVMPENLVPAQLTHMSKEELVNYFKIELAKMNRNHESKEQKMTEEYFSLRREYLREMGSSTPSRKDREFDALRKKIPVVILKLDEFVAENEKLPALTNVEKLVRLKDRLDSVLSENHRLRSLLTDKKKEIKYLSSKVSDSEETISKHSQDNASLSKLIACLKCNIEDSDIKASIGEEVYKCFLREMRDQISLKTQDSDVETIYRDASKSPKTISKCEIEDFDVESIIMQGLCGVIHMEYIKDIEEKLGILNKKYIEENVIRLSLEMEALENQNALHLEIAEKERLMQETILLAKTVEEKEKLMLEAAIELEQFELTSQELNRLKDLANRQQILIKESSKDSDIIRGNLVEALEKIQLYEVELCESNQKLEQAIKELRETEEDRRVLRVATLEMQNSFLLVQEKEREHMKQMGSFISLVNGMSKAFTDFECKVTGDIERNSSRFANLNSHLSSLIQKADVIKRTMLLYKEKFERRCSDLQKAEVEVDLLGDEVDVLLSLLEKIYIALDHYSPVLQHYPGIIEILKLVKRELSGDLAKSS